MSIPKDYFQGLVSDFDLIEMGDDVKIDIKWSKLIGVPLDEAQAVLDAQVWKDVQGYMPHDVGTLKELTNTINNSVHGEVYMYPPSSDYGHYQYKGIVYVDPVTKCAGFLTENGWKSRRKDKYGKKVPSDPVRKLKYSNPDAEAEWGKVAIDNHSKEWVDLVERTILEQL